MIHTFHLSAAAGRSLHLEHSHPPRSPHRNLAPSRIPRLLPPRRLGIFRAPFPRGRSHATAPLVLSKLDPAVNLREFRAMSRVLHGFSGHGTSDGVFTGAG